MSTEDKRNLIVKSGSMNLLNEGQIKNFNSRKRSRNPEMWLKSKRKKAILSGKSYVNTRGEMVLSKKIGPDCNCRNKCFQQVDQESRETIFTGYYNLKSYDEQNSYLYGLIRRHNILRKRHPDSMKRTCSYKYYVRIRGREVQVCKRAFASIHGISDKKIRTLCLKHEQNVMFPRDNRGKHCNRPKKVTGDVVRKVKQHIVQCLSGSMAADFIKSDKHQAPDINVTKLHRHFLSQHEPQAPLPDSDKLDKDYDAKVKPWVYFKVFHEEFKSLDLQSVKRRLSDVRRSLAGPSLVSVPSCQDRYGVCDTTAMPVAPIINVPTVGRPLTEISCGTYNECDVSRAIIPADNALTSHQNSNYQQQPLNLQVISAPNGSTMPSLNSTLHPGVSLAISGNGQPCYFSLSSIPANYVSSAALNSRPSLPSANIVSPPAARKLLTISPPTTTFITTTLEQQHGSPALINSAGPTSPPHHTILGAPSACFYSCCPVVAQVACNPSN